MASAPAFQFYAADFLTSAAELSLPATGLLIKALSQQWLQGSLPPEMDKLARVLGVLPAELAEWQEIAHLFEASGTDGRLRNRRLEKIREDQDQYRARQTARAKRGAAARWDKQPPEKKRKNAASIAQAMPEQCPSNAPSPSPSPSPPPPPSSSSPSSSPSPPPTLTGGGGGGRGQNFIEELARQVVEAEQRKGRKIKDIARYQAAVTRRLEAQGGLSQDEKDAITPSWVNPEREKTRKYLESLEF